MTPGCKPPWTGGFTVLNRSNLLGASGWRAWVLFAVLCCWGRALWAQPAAALMAAQPIWSAVDHLPQDRPAALVGIRARQFRSFQLNQSRVRQLLAQAPAEAARPLAKSPAVIELPTPEGGVARFRFVESPVMASELAAKFPEIKTYLGEGLDDPQATVRFDLAPSGLHAQVLSPNGAYYVDPAFTGDPNLHTAYYKRDYARTAESFQCRVAENVKAASRAATSRGLSAGSVQTLARSGSNLRTYRVAVAATGEYTAFHGGTVAGGLAAIVTAINRVTGIYESELAIRLVLVGNNDLLVYTNGATDPYTNGDPDALLDQNQTTIDSVIGSENYDLGHVFSTGGGGLASLGVVCLDGYKAQGETGNSSPIGDSFYVDYVVHELGHQFGANHTFNSTAGSCGGGNRNAATAYERGSGSTIMAYAGICDNDDLQTHSDPYFHSVSFDEILSYSTTDSGNDCAALTPTGNAEPTVSAGPNYTIPRGTPFTLTATGADVDGDVVTYCWEERDLGSATTAGAADNGSSPLFRSWNPTPDPTRTFPRLINLLNNTLPTGEVLPATTRALKFRVTARDNRAGGGGVSTADMQVNVTAAAGPFLMTSHNAGGSFSGLQTVTWDVAGTTNSPLSADKVNILLSTNGGLTFPITLRADAPNDGSQVVALPNIAASTARIKVEAAGNIFFDVGNANFSIAPVANPPPLVELVSATLVSENCANANQTIDPGETVTLAMTLANYGYGAVTNLSATLLATNQVGAPNGPQFYGALAAGETVTRNFTFTAGGSCGSTLTAVLALRDGDTDLPAVQQSFGLGVQAPLITHFTNATPLTIPGSGTAGTASVFPSTINVADVVGNAIKVTVTLSGLSHMWPSDMDALLVGPGGQKVLLISDVGGGNAINGVTLTLDDAAASGIAGNGTITTGTFRPSNSGSDDAFSAPAPAGPYTNSLAIFNNRSPNGTWSLYVQDDGSEDVGSLSGGWQLHLTTAGAACCTNNLPVAELAISPAFSNAVVNVGGELTFYFAVTNQGPDSAAEVMVTNTLPTGFELVSALGSAAQVTFSGNNQVFAFGTLASGGTASGSVSARALVASLATNVASVIAATHDPVSTNNFALTSVLVNGVPNVSAVSNQTVFGDAVVGPLAFQIGDLETAAENLSIGVSSSNTLLVPATHLALTGSGSNRFLTITPAANQTGTTLITLSVSDPYATTETSFLVTVLPVNHPPLLAAIPDQKVHAGATLVITNTATDDDLPANGITFSLGANEPAGAQINALNGLLTWTPTDAFADSVQSLTVRATDDGVPNLSAERTFLVTVVSRPVISDLKLTNGEAVLTWTALAGQPYRLQYATNLHAGEWFSVVPDVTAGGAVAMHTNSFSVTNGERYFRVLVLP